MTLPLYRGAEVIRRDASANAGLYFERFFSGYQHDPQDAAWSIGTEKKAQLDKLVGMVGDAGVLEQHRLNLASLVRARQGDFQVFKANAPFITGSGYPHPIENGFSFHPVLGTPYLPGAAVKGLLRSWMTAWEDANDDLIESWFGGTRSCNHTPDQPAESAGQLIFFDAVPVRPALMRIEIATPHLGKWYEQGNQLAEHPNQALDPSRVPADWHDPNPIPFLAADGVELLFAIAPRGPLGSEPGRAAKQQQMLQQALAQLRKALDWIGAGAKTAVGYGLFDVNEQATADLREQVESHIKQASLTEQQLGIDNLEQDYRKARSVGRISAGDKVMQDLAALVKEAAGWTEHADRIQLADLAEAIYADVGWGSSKKKKERKANVAALRNEGGI